MITGEMIKEARDYIMIEWGNSGNADAVFAAASKYNFGGGFNEFLTNCVACGGDWGGMLLTGIRELFPDVWNAIPMEMGRNAFFTLAYVLILCGVDTSK